MGVGAGLYMYDVVVKKFTFAISSHDELLLVSGLTRRTAVVTSCANAVNWIQWMVCFGVSV